MGVANFSGDGSQAGTGVYLWPTPLGLSSSTVGTQNINAAGEAVATLFIAPKTGIIDRVYFRTATVTTGCTLDVRLETVGSNGYPSGTLWGTNTNNTTVIADTDDSVYREVTLTAGASVTEGDFVYLVLRISSGTPSSLLIGRTGSSYQLDYSAMSIRFSSSAWGTKQQPLVAGVRYSDGDYPNLLGYSPFAGAPTAQNVSDATNPDEYGTKLVLPFGGRIIGFWMISTSVAVSSSFTVKLYNADGSSLLASEAYSRYNVRAAGVHIWPFRTPYNAPPGTYVASFRGTGTNNIAVSYHNVKHTPVTITDWGTQMTRNNDGAWTEDNTRWPSMGLVIGGVNIRDRVV